MVRLREVPLRLLVFVFIFGWTWWTAPVLASARGDDAPAPGASTPQAPSPTQSPLTDLPPNLRVPPDLRIVLQQALRHSPTLQRQMQVLLHAQRVRMSVSYGGLRGLRLFQAHSLVKHHQYGALVVDTQLYAPADMVELFAHEMEHVCEQIEGVDLRALAARRDSGVYDFEGHFETRRAIEAGRRVSREAQGQHPDDQPTHTTY
jgi:hypothetical protein